MPVLRRILPFLLFLAALPAAGQPLVAWRDKPLTVTGDTVVLDSMSIVPETFVLLHQDKPLDSTQFILLPAEAKLVLSPSAPRTQLRAKYAVYPLLFTRTQRHKDQQRFTTPPDRAVNPFLYRPGQQKADDPFATGGLNKSGSLSRGISFGNTRDVSVNSSLNLQLSGRLTEGVDLTMVATDDNLPIQPDGTTQQLQEFDRVYVQLSGRGTTLIAGDFYATRPNSYFMNFNKRQQGLHVRSNVPVGDTSKMKLSVTGSAAISKGKFSRNIIQGVEGNQGPYRLRGAENEFFIVVLSGTEKVYIDGKLLVRGQENDYTINYNTSEITFTAKQLITKDKRIVVEFQYSDRSYARTLVHAGSEFRTERYALRFNAYSEQDNKNQPGQQALTDADRLRMFAVGDTLLKAVVPGVDSVAFDGSKVLYKQIDTLVASVMYQNVYVYSTDPDSAHYQLAFTNVGANNGNYVQYSSSANGKTFRWVPPVNGVPQGDHEPVILLITPKKKQMLTLGGDVKLSKHTFLTSEIGYSVNDVNTFSPYDQFDDQGYSGQLRIKDTRKISDSLELTLEGNYEYASRYFTPLERYRPVEFERDWNLGWGGVPRVPTADQHIAGAGAGFRKKAFSAGYDFGTFVEGAAYTGLKHTVRTAVATKSFTLRARGSVLSSTGNYGGTGFIRHRIDAVQKLTKRISINAYEEQEMNRIRRPGSDTLQLTSMGFFEWQGGITFADSAKHSFTVFYKQRTDYLPAVSDLKRATFAEQVGSTVSLHGNPNQQLRFTTSFRRLVITAPELTQQQPDNTLIGRVEYDLRAWKGVVTATTFYEAGSGLEVKKEYSYIEVPAGQGNFTWTDYNGDGVKQLNEFETAVYSDQARYIRVFTPTNQYIKVYTNQFSQSLNLRPAIKWANKKGFRGFIARFSDQAVYRVDRKTQSSDASHALVPTIDDSGDSALVALNATIRNTAAFNQLSSKFGIEHTWQDLRGKSLLTNGLESRSHSYNEVRVRWNLTKSLSLVTEYRDGLKRNGSEFFSSRNFRIRYYEVEPKFSIQPGTTFRVTFTYRYSQKQNAPDLGNEKATVQKFGTEVKLSKLSKGNFIAQVNYVRIDYNGVASSAVGYDMLEGLKTGENYTWRVNWQRSLAQNLQLTLGYEGRKTPGVDMIHTGSAQVRAIF